MAIDLSYTEGVIAAKDKYLLKDKLLRLCEMTADDAFRSLLEYGFGGGAETASSVFDYEKLIQAEETALDEFILQYAPTKADAEYLLSPRDFHNAKALMKAKLLGADSEKMLASEGLIPISVLESAIQSGNYTEIAKSTYLYAACTAIEKVIADEKALSGLEIGLVFERELYRHLLAKCKHSFSLKRSIVARLDMTNVLTAFRAQTEEKVTENFIEGGKLSLADVLIVLSDGWKSGAAYARYPEFVTLCRDAVEKKMPLTLAERYRDGYDVEKLSENRFELKRNEPFLYYVLRRRAENANVRIIFALQLLGASEQEMKKRLRGI